MSLRRLATTSLVIAGLAALGAFGTSLIASKREAYAHITVADIDTDKANGAVETATDADGGRVVAAPAISGASAIAVPWWPERAACGASIARPRIMRF